MNKQYNNLDIKNLVKTEWFNQFNELQQEQIKLGLEKQLDVSIYAKIDFNWEQMEEIRLGLEANLNVLIYATPEYTWEQMNIILEGLKANVNISLLADPDIDEYYMTQILFNLIKERKYKKKNPTIYKKKKNIKNM